MPFSSLCLLKAPAIGSPLVAGGMTLGEKEKFVDTLLTALAVAALLIMLIYALGGCSCLSPKAGDIASKNAVKLTKIAPEPQTQVGLINVSAKTSIAEIMGILAFLGISVFVCYKALYHWRNSPTGKFLSEI